MCGRTITLRTLRAFLRLGTLRRLMLLLFRRLDRFLVFFLHLCQCFSVFLSYHLMYLFCIYLHYLLTLALLGYICMHAYCICISCTRRNVIDLFGEGRRSGCDVGVVVFRRWSPSTKVSDRSSESACLPVVAASERRVTLRRLMPSVDCLWSDAIVRGRDHQQFQQTIRSLLFFVHNSA